MDCRDAEFYLRLRHPGRDAFEPDLAAALDRHVAVCPACAAASRAIGGFDAAVVTAMRAVPVPDGLRDRLFADAAARRGSQLRHKTYRYAAAAATVLVAVGLALGVYSAARPQLDVIALAQRLEAHGQPRGGDQALAQFLAAERLPGLPETFDTDLLIHTGSERVQGREVPVLVFRERGGTGWAKVYAFRDTAFKAAPEREEQNSYCTARSYPARAGVSYVVVYTTPSLAPFLRGGDFTARAL